MHKFLFILMVMMTNSIFAQSPLNKTLGSFEKMTREGSSLLIGTNYGMAKITQFSENIFRIKIVKEVFEPDFSWAVVATPGTGELNINETDEKIEVKTSKITLIITKNPVRFTFLTVKGEIISQDDPEFGTSWISDEVTTFKTLQENERFIGLGEKTGNLDRRGESYVHWNTDNPHYESYTDPIYSTIPFYIGLHHKLCYGIFLDNTARSFFNFGASQRKFSYFGAESGEMDYYFIYDQDVAGIIRHYTWLTGRMEMPPLWALGYQQCRWSYYPESEVLNLAETFREKQIPADVLYLDIDYMDAYKVFTWNPVHFPDPEGMLNKLKQMGFHVATIIDPGIKVEKGYHTWEDGTKKDVFIKYPGGTPYEGMVWPGWCNFTDYTSSKGREWWGNQFKPLVEKGVEGFWNDMNEISTWGQMIPNMVEFDWEGHKTNYKTAKNVYGMLMARSTFEGTKKLLGEKRPLIITRSGYAGLQRYTSIWTGDNQATDDHMMLGVRMVNSIGLAGIPFTGYDVGGFGGDATKELFTRWISLGAFCPFYRTHSAIGTNLSEPWSYGEFAEQVAKKFISLRYRLLPYIYSAFYESTRNGMPVARSLAIDYPFRDETYDQRFQHQYLFGPSMMVIPVKSDESSVKAWLPSGDWYDMKSFRKYKGDQHVFLEAPLNHLPVLVKGGAIIPFQSQIQHTSEKPSDTLDIYIFNGGNGTQFTYYEDDGTNYDYEKGNYYKRVIEYDIQKNQVRFGKTEGSFISRFKYWKLILVGFEDELSMVINNDKVLKTVRPEKTDLGGKKDPGTGIQCAAVEASDEEITIMLIVKTIDGE